MVIPSMTLAAYLEKRGLTRADFARLIGVRHLTVTRYVRGEQIPEPEYLRRIYRATDGMVTPNDFILSE